MLHAFDMATPFGSVQFSLYRHDKGLLGADTIIVNAVQYEYRQAVKFDGIKWVADYSAADTVGYNIRRKDWRNRAHNQDGPTDSARQRIDTIIDKLNEEWESLEGQRQSRLRLCAETEHVQRLVERQEGNVSEAEHQLNNEKQKLADLQNRLENTKQGIFD